MSTQANTLSVNILDKEYRIACPTDAESDLLESAHFVDQQMRDIRNSGRVLSIDKIAVMAALNIAHELIKEQKKNQGVQATVDKQVQLVQDKLRSAITRNRPTVRSTPV